MKKHIFYTELAYLVGIFILTLGTALMELADYGVSMVVAPAYLIYLKLSQYLSFFTFGMAEYTLQAVLVVATSLIIRKFKLASLFSFVTAVLYGILLDVNMKLVSVLPCDTSPVRIVIYIVGFIFSAMGVSLLFHTYLSPEAYELFVKEVSAHFHADIHKFKTCYDCTSCTVSVLLSFCLFGWGHFEGIKIGTILCAVVNGWLISRCTHIFEHFFDFADRLGLRRYFEK